MSAQTTIRIDERPDGVCSLAYHGASVNSKISAPRIASGNSRRLNDRPCVHAGSAT
jgi:hypothetical protein